MKATEATFEVIEALSQRGKGRVTELDLPKSIVHRHLSTLEDLEYIANEGGAYRLGFRFLKLGERARTRSEAYQLAGQKVDDLAEETGECAQFIVHEYRKGVYVFRAAGERAVQTDSEVGKRIPLHATAAGKAILTHLPRERTAAIVDCHGLEPVTPNTMTEKGNLLDELEVILEQRYSINNQENTEGLRAVGVPVQHGSGAVIGALSVPGPTHWFSDKFVAESLPTLLLGAANELALNIQYT
ncbi:IclR family transcriptional regulator [Natrarchaeobaculum sulfurireducens]|uniref:DNA-binding transcriptional regulator, IclR family n=1 Tax=Natrarchaeobaculum sulfurireducens TaxID=2044521 RepID=A0A346PKB4_9EURY|nr:IclR family transcriptional regulator [Natrarchaeobaculum sulfurireducens]AXR79959.1 DNA-binding transcriptional regulator, IclR family [Natrarchaeobaculum sulfurireducens]